MTIILHMDIQRKAPECPYCGAALRPVVMACDHCEVEVRGRFRETHFNHLSADDQAFLERYLLAGFSIKALAAETGLGYVAIRNRLDRLIATYQALHDGDRRKRGILDRLEKGEIDATEAERLIRNLA